MDQRHFSQGRFLLPGWHHSREDPEAIPWLCETVGAPDSSLSHGAHARPDGWQQWFCSGPRLWPRSVCQKGPESLASESRELNKGGHAELGSRLVWVLLVDIC